MEKKDVEAYLDGCYYCGEKIRCELLEVGTFPRTFHQMQVKTPLRSCSFPLTLPVDLKSLRRKVFEVFNAMK